MLFSCTIKSHEVMKWVLQIIDWIFFLTQYLGDVICWESHRYETIGFTARNGLQLTSRWPCWWKKNGKKSLLGIGLGYYLKLELHFSLFWHQNGRVITLRISKNMFPKLGVIIEMQLLPLAAWQCQLRRWLCSEIWATSTLAWI